MSEYTSCVSLTSKHFLFWGTKTGRPHISTRYLENSRKQRHSIFELQCDRTPWNKRELKVKYLWRYYMLLFSFFSLFSLQLSKESYSLFHFLWLSFWDSKRLKGERFCLEITSVLLVDSILKRNKKVENILPSTLKFLYSGLWSAGARKRRKEFYWS